MNSPLKEINKGIEDAVLILFLAVIIKTVESLRTLSPKSFGVFPFSFIILISSRSSSVALLISEYQLILSSDIHILHISSYPGL